MANSVPQKTAFNKAEKSYCILNKITIIAAVVSILGTVISRAAFFIKPFEVGFAVVSVLFLTGGLYFQQRFSTTYQKAENIRRDGLVDSAFGTKMADIQSDGYYDTEEVEIGLRKLLANIHENSLLSERILEPTFRRKEIFSLIAFVLLVIVAFLSSLTSQVFLAALQVYLSANFLGDFFRLRELQGSINEVQSNCKKIWEILEQYGEKKMSIQIQGKIIREVIRYETSLAYASVLFEQKVYDEINDSTTEEWYTIRERYKI